jgi:hypothetical protein
MKITRAILVAASAVLVGAAIVCASQTLTATTDVNGKARGASAKIDGPSNVRCTSANGQAGGEPASCQIHAPGFSGKVEIGKTISIQEEGYVELKCNGNPPLRCSAEITP